MPKCMSYHGAIARLVINGKGHRDVHWPHHTKVCSVTCKPPHRSNTCISSLLISATEHLRGELHKSEVLLVANHRFIYIIYIYIYIHIYIYIDIYIHIFRGTQISAMAWRTVHEHIVADAFHSKKSSWALLVHEEQASQKWKWCFSSR